MAAIELALERMTPSAIAIALSLSIVPLWARADDEDRAALSTYVYSDSDGLTVVHPSASGVLHVTPELRLDARYDADVISSATIDVRTSASVRPFEEVRHGGRVGAMLELARTLRAGASYQLSWSPDYQAHSLGLSGRAEDDERVLSLGLDLRASHDVVGRAGDPSPSGEASALGAALTGSSVIASWLVLDASLALEWQHGYLESPYRLVWIRGLDQERVVVSEQVPDDRVRTALSMGLRAALDPRVFVRAGYRLHADDWGVLGHTVELRASLEPHEDWLVTLQSRLLIQRGASFYQGTYATLPAVPLWRTRDRELAPSHATSIIAIVDWRFLREGELSVHVSARGELLYHRYLDTPLLPERVGAVTGLALTLVR